MVGRLEKGSVVVMFGSAVATTGVVALGVLVVGATQGQLPGWTWPALGGCLAVATVADLALWSARRHQRKVVARLGDGQPE